MPQETANWTDSDSENSDFENNQEQEDWSDLHPDFAKIYWGETYQQTWEEEGLTYQDAQEWIPFGFTPGDYYEIVEWKEYFFTPAQVQAWLKIGLTIIDYEFAGYLNYKGYQPSWDLPWQEIWKQGIPASEYLEWKYPNAGTCLRKNERYNSKGLYINNYGKTRTEITKLDISGRNLAGELDLSAFPNLEELYCHNNQLTKIILPIDNQIREISASDNLLNTINYEQLNPDTLTTLYLSNNNLASTNLTFFSQLVNLEELWIDNNNFEGSLGSLSALSKLETLNIKNNELVIKPEDLSSSLKSFCYSRGELSEEQTRLINKIILDNIYPDKSVKELKLWNKGLQGQLDLSEYLNLEELDCSSNQLTNLDITALPVSLIDLNIRYNESLNNNLIEFSHLVNLRKLDLGNTQIKGSLEALQQMSKLESLDISDTDINELDVTKLPASLEKISYNYEPTCKLTVIVPQLDKWTWKDIHPDFTPEKRRCWEREKFNHKEAKQLVKAGFSAYYGYDEAKKWVDWGFTIQQIKELILAGFSHDDYDKIGEWTKKGFNFDQIKGWKSVGLETNDYEFANYLREKNYLPADVSSGVAELKVRYWKDTIHPDFTEELKKQWIKYLGERWENDEIKEETAYQAAQAWISAGLVPQEAQLARWLVNQNYIPNEQERQEERWGRNKTVFTWQQKEQLSQQYLAEWGDLHFDFNFNETHQQNWQEQGFTKTQTQQYLSQGFKVSDLMFLTWLRDNKKMNLEKVIENDVGSLRKKYHQAWTKLDAQFAKNIIEEYDETYQQHWEEAGISYQEAQKWNKLISLSDSYYDRCWPKEWISQGFTPAMVQPWLEVGFESGECKKVQQWKKHNFTPQQTQAWLINDLSKSDSELAAYLRYKGQKPSWNLWKQMGTYVKEYLDWRWPLEQRNTITKLDISHQNLTGELDLITFSNLKWLYCASNQLTKLILPLNNRISWISAGNNLLTTFDYAQLNPQTLTVLSINDNNLPTTDLSVFSKLVNLERLYIGNNPIKGSLESLKNMSKLNWLDISNTDINAGVEYLPVSIRYPKYSTKLRTNCQLKEIEDELKEFKEDYQSFIKKKLKENNQEIKEQELILQKFEEKEIFLRNRLEEYKPVLQNKLGEGGFSLVYQGTWKGNPVAIKKSKFSASSITEKELQVFEDEVNLLKKLNNPYIILYVDMYKDEQDLMVITELAQQGTLTDYINQHKSQEYSLSDWTTNYNFIRQMTLGLTYLHHSNIIHRDLKSMNILICEGQIAKIADFGISKVINEFATNRTTSKGFGTMAWMDPYYFKAQTHSFQTDIYSLGVVFWEIVAKKLPYSHIPHDFIICQILAGHKEDIPTDTPPVLKEIIADCWEDDFSKRISLEQIKIKMNKMLGIAEEKQSPSSESDNYESDFDSEDDCTYSDEEISGSEEENITELNQGTKRKAEKELTKEDIEQQAQIEISPKQ